MHKKTKFSIIGLAIFILLVVSIVYLRSVNIPVLQPQGTIAQKQLDLIYLGLALSLIIVIPVFGLTAFIATRYHEGNTKAKYRPNSDGNNLAELVWWIVPAALITVLSLLIWKSSYALDPYKPISSQKPVIINVVALDWKWLFMYPDEGIASVNYFQIPVDKPIRFNITADAPMNSFWVPQLGSQIYAMPGMSTELNLKATAIGDYRGSSANISGRGFAGMTFTARATSDSDYMNWVKTVQQSPNVLDKASYKQLAKPSQNNPLSLYKLPNSSLYDDIVMKYMGPMHHHDSMKQPEMN